MNRPTVALILLALGAGTGAWSHAADLRPDDFAYGMPMRTPGEGAAYRLTIPLEVYRNVSHEDLSDLRIFNAQGEEVPYELRPLAAQASARAPEQVLPLFPLQADARATLNGVHVTVQSPGANVDLHASPWAAAPPAIASYVLDARMLDRPLSALRLQWPAGAPDFSGAVRVESSDDLSSWRVARAEAPVVNLRTGGAELVQDLVEFSDTRAKFWKLTWLGKSPPFELSSVSARQARQEVASPKSSVIVTGTPAAKSDGAVAFDLGGQLPVTQVNLTLPDSNSALTLELLSRARPTDPWRPVFAGEFYRVGAGAGEHSNAPIRIRTNFDRFWLVRRIQPSGPIGRLRLRATWNAREVLFLARGAGPFLLAYGNATAGQASISLAPLLQGITPQPATAGASFALGGAGRLHSRSPGVPWKMAVLWSALGLAVLVLAWMAYQLTRQLDGRAENPPG